MEPILAKRLEEVQLDQVQIGWFFMILPAAYIPSAIALDYLPKHWDKRKVIITGMICCALSLFCVGPSTLLDVEGQTLRIMVAGQILLGLFIPVGLILALPSMVECVIGHYPNQVSRVNNLSSGVFNTANGLGEVIGPMFGAALYEDYGFRTTSDITALITFGYVLVFIFILSRAKNFITSKVNHASSEYEDSVKHKEGMKKKLDSDDSSHFNESLLSSSGQSMFSGNSSVKSLGLHKRINDAKRSDGVDAAARSRISKKSNFEGEKSGFEA